MPAKRLVHEVNCSLSVNGDGPTRFAELLRGVKFVFDPKQIGSEVETSETAKPNNAVVDRVELCYAMANGGIAVGSVDRGPSHSGLNYPPWGATATISARRPAKRVCGNASPPAAWDENPATLRRACSRKY